MESAHRAAICSFPDVHLLALSVAARRTLQRWQLKLRTPNSKPDIDDQLLCGAGSMALGIKVGSDRLSFKVL